MASGDLMPSNHVRALAPGTTGCVNLLPPTSACRFTSFAPHGFHTTFEGLAIVTEASKDSDFEP